MVIRYGLKNTGFVTTDKFERIPAVFAFYAVPLKLRSIIKEPQSNDCGSLSHYAKSVRVAERFQPYLLFLFLGELLPFTYGLAVAVLDKRHQHNG